MRAERGPRTAADRCDRALSIGFSLSLSLLSIRFPIQSLSETEGEEAIATTNGRWLRSVRALPVTVLGSRSLSLHEEDARRHPGSCSEAGPLVIGHGLGHEYSVSSHEYVLT